MTETWYRVDNGILWIANQPIDLPHPVKVPTVHKPINPTSVFTATKTQR